MSTVLEQAPVAKPTQVGVRQVVPGMLIKIPTMTTDEMLYVYGSRSVLTEAVVGFASKYPTQFTIIDADGAPKMITRSFPGYAEVVEGAEREEWMDKLRAAIHKKPLLADRGYNGLEKLGSDPEIFVVDEHGTVIPAFQFLPAEADSKKRYSNYTAEAATWVFWDGFQAEFNIPPHYCHAYITDYMQAGLAAVLAKARIFNAKASLTSRSVVEVPFEMMQAAAPEHTTLGCAPSENIYPDVEPIAVSGRDLPLRFAGCHIHYGFGTLSAEQVRKRVRAMDMIFGPIMTSLLEGIEDPRRRRFYGKAGEHRLPAHGLEYRVPSSSMLCHPLVTHICLDMCRFAAHLPVIGLDKWWVEVGDDQINDILNNYNIDEARQALNVNMDILMMMLNTCYGALADGEKRVQKVLSMIMKGARHHLASDAMERAWHINDKEHPWLQHSAAAEGCVTNMTI